ncbi:MAG: histidine phosphatase family protein [Caldilineaceae bacterium]|nr:histidine phosphatase family protein [Caldilineaceae bacterium]
MLYLITHAHTQQQRDVDAATWTLSERGGQQAATLAREQFWANVTRIVLSSEPKTRLTVEPVLAARDLPVTVDARFNELKRPAAWTDDYVAAVAAAFDRPHESVNGWEAAAAAQARFIHGIEDLCQRFPNGTFALVGHGLTFSLYRAALLGQAHVDLNDWRKLSFAAIAQVDLVTGRLIEDFRSVTGEKGRAE